MEMAGRFLSVIALLAVCNTVASVYVACSGGGWCCPAGGKRCYKAYCTVESGETRNQTQGKCTARGYQLATVVNMDEFIAASMAKTIPDCMQDSGPQEDDAWIGLYCPDGSSDATDTCWEWDDGTVYLDHPETQALWSPNDPDGDECVEMDGSEYNNKFDTSSCTNTRYQYLCHQDNNLPDDNDHYLFGKTKDMGLCFHADAAVRVQHSEEPVQVKELAVGDKVMSVDADGGVKYDEVYSVAHKDLYAGAKFVVNVFTKSGLVVVDDILAGVYVNPFPPRAAHQALYPARMLASLLGRIPAQLNGYYADNGWPIWVNMMNNVRLVAAGLYGAAGSA